MARIAQQEGARWLAVSNVEEGVVLRQGGITARILVMGFAFKQKCPDIRNTKVADLVNDPTYTVEVYRIGWYGGAGGRLVPALAERGAAGRDQPGAEAALHEVHRDRGRRGRQRTDQVELALDESGAVQQAREAARRATCAQNGGGKGKRNAPGLS